MMIYAQCGPWTHAPGAARVANDNTPDDAVETELGAIAPAKKRPARRRVTRTPVAADAVAPAVESAPDVDTAVDESATRPQAAAPEQAQSPAQVLAQLPVEAPATSTPAPPARRSRRVTRTVVLPVEAPAAVVDVPEVTDEAAPAEPEQEPDTPVEETPVEEAPADEALVEEAPALDVLAELGGLRPAEPQAAPAAARIAATALLFQAPEPSVRSRRRRVQSQAGSPQEISGTTRVADLFETAPTESEEPTSAPVEPVGAGPEAPDATSAGQSSGRGSGRSSGRRRGRARAAEAVSELVGEPTVEDVPPVTDEDGEDIAAEPQGEALGSEDGSGDGGRRRRRRGGRGRRPRSEQPSVSGEDDEEAGSGQSTEDVVDDDETSGEAGGGGRRRRRRRRGGRAEGEGEQGRSDEVTALRGSTRLEAKRQRRRDGRDAGRRRQTITEAEFLARRESVDRVMVVRERAGRTQIAVLEDGVLVEHYVSNQAAASMVGNVYLGRVQNVLPSMEAAFVDVGKGRNAVLYAGEVNWDAAGLDGQPRRIEQALKSGDQVLVQVTKDPIGHKGARLTSQVTLAGRYLVLVPGGGMTGISHKLPDVERNRLKKILRAIVPEAAGVIVRTAAEGASEEELAADIERLQGQWDAISAKAKTASAPALLQGEPDMAIRVVRDIFNDDFSALVVAGEQSWSTISSYIDELAPDLAAKVSRWPGEQDVFAKYRVDEQLAKGMDRKVWLPSGGSLVIDRTEAMTVVDVNTGKFTGSGGTLEETVTRNNLEAAEEIVRQLRLRDIGGMIVVDFIDMVLASNRDLVLRRLVECLGRDRTKHQVAEVTTLGLVQ
ncbi:MAG: Rne/Rng family ribonuclease, partial [Actinobacteria bacterium]|nr:Rne/Rng family ribonuclease [Actinomycetota bacterium]